MGWTKSELIHKKKYEADVIYVLDPFSGPCFQHLKRIKARLALESPVQLIRVTEKLCIMAVFKANFSAMMCVSYS